LKIYTSKAIVNIIAKPDQTTTAILRDILLSPILKHIVLINKNNTPIMFIFQSKNPLDLLRKIFQTASQIAEIIKKKIPIIVLEN
jgi:hypothetical protein